MTLAAETVAEMVGFACVSAAVAAVVVGATTPAAGSTTSAVVKIIARIIDKDRTNRFILLWMAAGYIMVNGLCYTESMVTCSTL